MPVINFDHRDLTDLIGVEVPMDELLEKIPMMGADLHDFNRATGEIASLVVKSTCRGEGIGKGLVDTAVDWLIDIGCPSIRIRANAVRKAAHGFYQALGFRCVKTQKVFRKDIDGA